MKKQNAKVEAKQNKNIQLETIKQHYCCISKYIDNIIPMYSVFIHISILYYLLCTEYVNSFIDLSTSLMGSCAFCLLQSGGEWLAVISWRWKLLSWDLHLAHPTCHMVMCPDDHCAVLGHSQDSGYQLPSTKSSPMSFPVQQCKKTKWLAALTTKLPLFLSITHIYSKLWTISSCGAEGLSWMILWDVPRCSP